jgi:DNA-binding PadR family transcriptional regulator
MKAEALKGHLDSMILAVLAAGPAHGYAVIEQLRRRSGGVFDLPEGTVYPALHRLEEDGLLTSSWATANGRRRRVYTLTRRGRAALGKRRGDWRLFSQAVDGVLA